MLVPNTNTRARCTGDDESAPKTRDSTPVGAAQLAVKDTSADGPVFAVTPKGDGPRPQDWRGGVRVKGRRLEVLAPRHVTNTPGSGPVACTSASAPCRASTSEHSTQISPRSSSRTRRASSARRAAHARCGSGRRVGVRVCVQARPGCFSPVTRHARGLGPSQGCTRVAPPSAGRGHLDRP